ncbi:pantetheine-phosphate adenylyltransferase [Sphingomonas sp. AP4-R1]|uniref:pantetheine-phosphate adenylyltransferase n=1 Tax=Sphingomonas sp. AP4-R1 TaxID=2735134 RepID=UPI001493B4F4|nr:pantetheine-phosphate adenylyltransferase [Sphingomonas sp. AP4-R1]QJU57559.1 pantetheine-phosphate adenylyltransferase [Sphingomonas sp. AP4-R1]
MSRTAVYPGTFDPPTLGHMDIIGRAASMFDRLVVGVFTNSAKSPLFSIEERLAIMERETSGLNGRIEVRSAKGLLVDFAASVGAVTIVRGLRNASDFDYEAQMAGINGQLAPDIDTIFLVAEPRLQPISSTLVRDIARGGGSVAAFVTPAVAAELQSRLGA